MYFLGEGWSSTGESGVYELPHCRQQLHNFCRTLQLSYRKATEGLGKSNLLGHNEMVAFACENIVLLLLQDQHNISWLQARFLRMGEVRLYFVFGGVGADIWKRLVLQVVVDITA